MKRGLFVTGTDTGIGKTSVSCALLAAFAACGESTAGMKPVASGGNDIELLAAASTAPAPRNLANPYFFPTPAAPDIAAEIAGESIDLAHILECYRKIDADRVVVEGIGGFRVPLNLREDVSDLARRLSLPVVLVVGMRLGCINHALLSADAIRDAGLQLAGWVANRIDPEMAYFEQNLLALENRIPGPLLGVIPFDPGLSPSGAARFLDLDKLAL